MNALIIGAAGFVGGYLSKHLKEALGWNITATKMKHEELNIPDVNIVSLDILNKQEIISLLFDIKPDCIFHLAAQSSVSVAWKNPALTVDVNIKGSLNVLDAVRELFYKPRILLIGSGEEYGHVRPEDIPIREETLLRPGNLYAATKACQNMIGKIYTDAYDMNIMMVRAFNHIGPNQAPLFVVSDFCKQVVEIERGLQEPVIHVGNLSVFRDFTDVRDVVRAYSAIILQGKRGETYNVGSGKAMEIREMLETILSFSTASITIETDPAKLRPVDVPIIEADTSKLYNLTSWKPLIPFQQTVQETLDYWRNLID